MARRAESLGSEHLRKRLTHGALDGKLSDHALGISMNVVANAGGGTGPTSGTKIGEFTLGDLLWKLPLATAFRADGPPGQVVMLLIHPTAAQSPAVRAAIGTRAAQLARLGEHPHLLHTLGAGEVDGQLFLVVADIDGNPAREVLVRKQASASGGFGVQGAAKLVVAAAAALTASGVVHGALTAESMVVSRTSGIRLVDLGLGTATVAAMTEGIIAPSSMVAPEVLAGGEPSVTSDVYGLGAMLYEALVGRPLERGGPRPSEVVPDLPPQFDELVARACHRDPGRRFGSVEVFRELVADAVTDVAAAPSQASDHAVATAAPDAAPPRASGVGAARVMAAEQALASAMADGHENWLVARAKFDYGPYSLATIVAQIKSGEIVAGNIIIDKDTGARIDAATHPLLAPLVDASRQARDDARRAQAEVAHQGREKRQGVALFGVIGLGVVAVGLAVWLVVRSTSSAETTKVAGINSLAVGAVEGKISMPKPPPPKPKNSGGRSSTKSNGGGGGGGGGDDDDDDVMSLDMGADGLGSEKLSMSAIYGVYSQKAGALGGCVSRGGGSAHISFVIDGPTGKVKSVSVNGQKSGGLQGCISGVLRSLTFPAVDGPRTRATFDIGG